MFDRVYKNHVNLFQNYVTDIIRIFPKFVMYNGGIPEQVESEIMGFTPFNELNNIFINLL